MRWCAATTAWRNSPLLLVRQRVPSICIIGRLFWTAGRRQDGWNQDARHVHQHMSNRDVAIVEFSRGGSGTTRAGSRRSKDEPPSTS